MSIANLNDEDRKNIEEQISSRKSEVQPTYQHYGSVEDMSENDRRVWEAQVKASRTEVQPTYQHYGSLEDMSAEDIKSWEAQLKARRSEVQPTYQHYGSAEDMNANDRSILEAHVAEKRKEDIPSEEYFSALAANPTISDEQQFENAVIRSIQSNRVMKEFTTDLVDKISRVTTDFKNIDETDTASINNQKQQLENLVGVYEKYLYALKSHGWDFNGADNESGIEMISYDTLDDMMRVQSQFGLTFTMPIPGDLGEDYGQAFERDGHMIATIPLMYDDLKNKEVNWHRALIYKENELTPYQSYLQRKEAAEKQFDSARKEEIKDTLTNTRSNQTEMNSMLSNTESKGQSDVVSIRSSK